MLKKQKTKCERKALSSFIFYLSEFKGLFAYHHIKLGGYAVIELNFCREGAKIFDILHYDFALINLDSELLGD